MQSQTPMIINQYSQHKILRHANIWLIRQDSCYFLLRQALIWVKIQPDGTEDKLLKVIVGNG